VLQANSISTVKTLDRAQHHIVKQPVKQKFLWALITYAVICSCLALLHVGTAKPSDSGADSGERTWTTWAIDRFCRLPSAPQVVLLGSSLVLTPINLADAQILGKTLDGSEHHESVYFSQLVKQLTGKRIQAFNFALPGEMPSDAFLITKLLLKGPKRPSVIVYGVGPRDFMDNLLVGPTATDPYRYLSRLGSHIPDPAFTGNRWDQKVDGFFSRAIYLYGNREDLATRFDYTFKKFVSEQIPPDLQDHQLNSGQLHILFPLYHPMSIAPGECVFRPMTEQTGPRFKDNLEEYRRRYGTLNWETFLGQLKFLADFLDLARKQHTEAVIVSMPITTVNRSLIPPLAWDAYKHSLRVITVSKGARFVDLDESKQFTDSDFGDTVHLNTVGGIKLVQLIVANVLQKDCLKSADETVGQASPKRNLGADL
jgi:hypothetical protein